MQTIKHAFLPVLQFSMISLSVRISRLPVGSNEKNRIQLNSQNWQRKLKRKIQSKQNKVARKIKTNHKKNENQTENKLKAKN